MTHVACAMCLVLLSGDSGMLNPIYNYRLLPVPGRQVQSLTLPFMPTAQWSNEIYHYHSITITITITHGVGVTLIIIFYQSQIFVTKRLALAGHLLNYKFQSYSINYKELNHQSI